MKSIQAIPIFHLFLGLLLIVSARAQEPTADSNRSSVGTGQICKYNQISSMNVQFCECDQLKRPECRHCDLNNCKTKSHTHSGLTHCGLGCIDDNSQCDSCYLWFQKLCLCLQHGCPTRKASSGNFDWVLMDDNLITATQLIPGIRELYVEDPWTWGQQLWKPGKGALAINSVRTRSQEQIHMHICRAHNETQRFLGQLDFTHYLKAMTEVTEKKWMCQAGETGTTSLDGMVAKVQGQLANDRWCPDFIGAAMIPDSQGRIWACVTTEESETTEFSFCY